MVDELELNSDISSSESSCALSIQDRHAEISDFYASARKHVFRISVFSLEPVLTQLLCLVLRSSDLPYVGLNRVHDLVDTACKY